MAKNFFSNPYDSFQSECKFADAIGSINTTNQSIVDSGWAIQKNKLESTQVNLLDSPLPDFVNSDPHIPMDRRLLLMNKWSVILENPNTSRAEREVAVKSLEALGAMGPQGLVGPTGIQGIQGVQGNQGFVIPANHKTKTPPRPVLKPNPRITR
jgi:hypothetical protein